MKKSNFSKGSRALVKVALENDKAKGLTNNITLVKSLEALKLLLDYSREEEDSVRFESTSKYLGREINESSFLFLVALFIKRIESEASNYVYSGDSKYNTSSEE